MAKERSKEDNSLAFLLFNDNIFVGGYMVKVNKENDSIYILVEEGNFCITFKGNLYLYFCYYGKDCLEKDYHSFEVNKDNYFLYKCIDKLYDAIVCERPFKNGGDSSYVKPCKWMPYPLLKDKIIQWHSDDGFYDEASILFIEKCNDFYKITIKEGMISDIRKKTSSVRLRNHGSRYDPYNAAFMALYNALMSYNFKYEQITMDEYVSRINIRTR